MERLQAKTTEAEGLTKSLGIANLQVRRKSVLLVRRKRVLLVKGQSKQYLEETKD